MPMTYDWMLIRRDDYRRLRVADCLLCRLLDEGDRDMAVITVAGAFAVPDSARLLAREWLDLRGPHGAERETDPALEGVTV